MRGTIPHGNFFAHSPNSFPAPTISMLMTALALAGSSASASEEVEGESGIESGRWKLGAALSRARPLQHERIGHDTNPPPLRLRKLPAPNRLRNALLDVR